MILSAMTPVDGLLSKRQAIVGGLMLKTTRLPLLLVATALPQPWA